MTGNVVRLVPIDRDYVPVYAELASESPGSAFDYLVETASDKGPADLSERSDYYLFGVGYREWFVREKPVPKKRARVR